jgi:hypothetical protein
MRLAQPIHFSERALADRTGQLSLPRVGLLEGKAAELSRYDIIQALAAGKF